MLYGFPIISPLLALVFSVLLLLSVFKPNDPVPYNTLFVLIFGILILVFGSFIGGVLVIIGAIFGLLA